MIPYSALTDASTSALLALSPEPFVVSFLAKSQPLEAEQQHGVNWPNYRQNFTLAGGDGVLPRWTWDRSTRMFSLTPELMLTSQLRQRSLLAMAKCAALSEIVYELSVARYQVHRGILLQDVVYAAKRAQAQAYKARPHDDATLYPYVAQYADFSGLMMRDAADEILFKAKLDEDFLLKSEGLRLKYLKALGDTSKPEEIGALLQGFRQELYRSRQF